MTHSLSVDAQSIASTAQQAAAPIQYTVSFPEPHTHYVEVSAEVPAAGRQSIEMMMAVWTPGSYLVREYARHVENVAASAGGRRLPVEKTDKNRWRVTTGGAATTIAISCDPNTSSGNVGQYVHPNNIFLTIIAVQPPWTQTLVNKVVLHEALHAVCAHLPSQPGRDPYDRASDLGLDNNTVMHRDLTAIMRAFPDNTPLW